MSNVEFLKFERTPNEKYLGLATIRLYGKMIVIYKINTGKDGSLYMNSASFKVGETFRDALTIDSSYEAQEIKSVVVAACQKAMNTAPSALPQQSAEPDDDDFPF